jgi:hypothetical protein
MTGAFVFAAAGAGAWGREGRRTRAPGLPLHSRAPYQRGSGTKEGG